MSDYMTLALDSTGSPSYNHPSKLFCVLGVVIENKYRSRLANQILKIKKKYFSDPEIVLHYVQIVRKIKEFSALKNDKLNQAFWVDILNLINSEKIYLIFSVLDKNKAKSAGYQEKTIIRKSYRGVFQEFTRLLIEKNKNGQIITESDIFQNEQIIAAHTDYQSGGIDKLISSKDYCGLITSLAFVGKKNLDPDVQLADLLGSGVVVYHRVENLHHKLKMNPIEKNNLKLIKRKIIAGSGTIIRII